MQLSTNAVFRDNDLIDLAESLNQQLATAGAKHARQAYNLGSFIGIVLIILALLGLLVMKILNFLGVLLLAAVLALAWIGIATFLKGFIRQNAIHKAFHANTEPAINHFIASHNLSRIEFDRLASRLLPKDAPLQKYLYPSADPFTPEE